MKIKFFSAAMLMAALMLALTACGKPGTEPTQTTPESQTQTTPATTGGSDFTTPAQTTYTTPAQSNPATSGEETVQEAPWQKALAESLMENYGVMPVHYEDLGDGYYLVYVEVGGQTVPFVTVNSATGEYHG